LRLSIATLLSLLLASITSEAFSRETTIHKDALPVAVGDSLRARYPGATILRLVRDVDRGAVTYEAEMARGGRNVDASFDARGLLREEEARITTSELPAAVRRSIGGKVSILRAERLTSRGVHGSRFEILVSRHGVHEELTYSPDGRLLKRERLDRPD